MREKLFPFIIVVAVVIIVLILVLASVLPGILHDGSMVMYSGSMSHSYDDSEPGIIDENDIVYYDQVDSLNQLTTYVWGESVDYSRYGAYGDVVIYQPNGLSEWGDGREVIPIVHRIVVWLEINETLVNPDSSSIDYVNYSYDIPELGIYGSTNSFTLINYGFRQDMVVINLGRNDGLLRYFESISKVPHSGYITMGDLNSPAYDQPLSGGYEPVQLEWIVGKITGLKDR